MWIILCVVVQYKIQMNQGSTHEDILDGEAGNTKPCHKEQSGHAGMVECFFTRKHSK